MITITAIPAFNDNYIWCAYSSTEREAIIVDPGSYKEVLNFLNQHNLTLKAILITHHHPDHTGGVNTLKQETGATVYGPASSKLDIFDVRLTNDSSINALSLTFRVIEVPGHTLDHIAFYSEASKHLEAPVLFCGDTLFSGGCGRLFEGTAEQMLNSLNQLTELPETTLVYPAHEYTLANLDFALHISPNNQNIIAYNEACKDLRSKELKTLPTTIKQEKLINPFLRTSDTTLQSEFLLKYPGNGTTSLDIFTELRKAKDNY